MGVPMDVDARRYYRVGKQRLEEAQLILERLDLPATCVYLVGYAVECTLKALLLTITPAKERPKMLKSLKDDFGHNIRRLRAGVVQRTNVPRRIQSELVFLASWSPELRYEPGMVDPAEARRFLTATRAVVVWADGRM